MLNRTVLVALALCACEPSAPPNHPTPAPTSNGGEASTECAGAAPGPGYECVRDCGPPVAREGDPPPGYSWLSAKDAENRKQFGCPICLPGATRIATPKGDVALSSLRVGDALWTTDAEGARVVGQVMYAASTPLSGSHQVVHVTLADGRSVWGSPGHPTLSGGALGGLQPGDALSGSIITQVQRAPFPGSRTYDVLPSGSTGAYFANGVLLRSSFVR